VKGVGLPVKKLSRAFERKRSVGLALAGGERDELSSSPDEFPVRLAGMCGSDPGETQPSGPAVATPDEVSASPGSGLVFGVGERWECKGVMSFGC